MCKNCDEVKIVQKDDCVEEAKNAFLAVAIIVGIITIIGLVIAIAGINQRKRVGNA